MSASAVWTYEGYWAAVLGDRSAGAVVREFDLVADGLDEWLGTAEAASWSAGGSGALPREWARFHATALEELTGALA